MKQEKVSKNKKNISKANSKGLAKVENKTTKAAPYGSNKRVEISKYVDKYGTSFKSKYSADQLKEINSDTQRRVVIDKTSRYGVSPVVGYKDINYAAPTKKVVVVKDYDQRNFKQIFKAMQKEAKDISKNAVKTYSDEIENARMLTQKNLLVAKIDSFRLMNKAISIEKKYKENLIESARHKKVLADIKKLKNTSLTNNDLILKDAITKIDLNREVELNTSLEDKRRLEEKIYEQIEINKVVVKWKERRIRTLASGRKFNERISRKEIVANVDRSPMVYSHYSNEQLLVAYNELKNIAKPTAKQKEILAKVIVRIQNQKSIDKLINKSHLGEKRISEFNNEILDLKKNIVAKSHERKYVVVSMDQYKKVILDSKKAKFMVSEPMNKFATEYKTLHEYYETKQPIQRRTQTTALVVKNQARPQLAPRNDVEDQYTDRTILNTINKWKSIKSKVSLAQRYNVQKNNNQSYTIYYDEAKQSGLAERVNSLINNPIKYSKSRLNYLRMKLNQLPVDPVVARNKDYFISENLNLTNIINQFNKINIFELEITPEIDRLILEVHKVLDIYKYLVKEDKIARALISKSQILDEKLKMEMFKTKHLIATRRAEIENSYIAKINKIEIRSKQKTDIANQMHLVRREQILETEQNQVIKESILHAANKAYNEKNLSDFQKLGHKIENKNISSLVSELNKHNKKSKIKISMADIPSKIEVLEPIQNNNLVLQKKGSVIYAVTNNPESQVVHSAKLINKNLPTTPITKIVVLDKFRDVSNVLDRVAMLKELSEVSYAKAIKYNINRESNELAAAERKLTSELKRAQKMIDHSIVLDTYSNRIKHEALSVDYAQKHYESKKALSWKHYDKTEEFKNERIKAELKMVQRMNKKAELHKARLEKKEQQFSASSKELALYKAQKSSNASHVVSTNSISKFKNIFTKKSVDIDDVIGKK